MYGLFPYHPYFRNHAWLRFTYIFDARITDYMETHPYYCCYKRGVARTASLVVMISVILYDIYVSGMNRTFEPCVSDI